MMVMFFGAPATSRRRHPAARTEGLISSNHWAPSLDQLVQGKTYVDPAERTKSNEHCERTTAPPPRVVVRSGSSDTRTYRSDRRSNCADEATSPINYGKGFVR